MIQSRWLTGCDDLAPLEKLRGAPAEPLDQTSLHVMIHSDTADLAAGRLHDTAGVYLIDRLTLAPGADPQVMMLVAQLLVMKAAQLGAQRVYADAQGTMEDLLLDLGFYAVEPGDEPNATVVFPLDKAGGCSGCGSCGGCNGCKTKKEE